MSWARGWRPRVAAGPQVHGLPPPADGGGGRPRERGAGLGGAQLAAGPLVAGQGDAGYPGTVLAYSELVLPVPCQTCKQGMQILKKILK